MKRTFISLMSAVLLSCLCFGTSVCANSDGQADGVQQTNAMIPDDRQKPLVVDEAGILTEDELEQLNAKAESISEEYQCEAAVVYIDYLDDRSAQAYADDYYDYNGYGYGEGDDGILLLVAAGDREYAMTTYGSAIDVFTDSRLEKIETVIVEELGDNHWANAGNAFLEECEGYLNDGPPSYTGLMILGVPLCLLAGLLLSFIPMQLLKSQLRSVAKKSSAANYIRKHGVEIWESNDRLVNVTRTRTKIEEEHHSGGSSLHTSSSGRSHGGRSGKF